jgi:hypothetical protein
LIGIDGQDLELRIALKRCLRPLQFFVLDRRFRLTTAPEQGKCHRNYRSIPHAADYRNKKQTSNAMRHDGLQRLAGGQRRIAVLSSATGKQW